MRSVSSILSSQYAQRLSCWTLIGLTISVLTSLAITLSPVGAEIFNDRFKIEGWTEVDKSWPLTESGLYVAIQKGHHFIEVKLPKQLSGDIDIRLEYYYTFKNVRPLFQIVPCNTNIDILENHEQQLLPGQWHEHKLQVKRDDCQRRNELAYNVLLHDANDVFAWRLIELKSVGADPVESTGTTTTESLIESTTTLRPPLSLVYTESDSESTTTTTTSYPETITNRYDYTITTSANKWEYLTTGPNTSPQPETTSRGHFEYATEPTTYTYDRRDEEYTSTTERSDRYNLRKRSTTNKVSGESNNLLMRFKRWFADSNDDSSQSAPASIYLVCRPNSCDRKQFNFERFIVLPKGIPGGVEGPLMAGQQLFLSTDNKMLNVVVESVENLLQEDTCLNLTLFMEADTSLDFFLEEEVGSSQEKQQQRQLRLLETIKRKARDSGASKWDQFERCISDYMPKLSTVAANEQQQQDEVHRLKFSFVPSDSSKYKQLAILSDPQRSSTLKVHYEPHTYLPNLLNDELPVDENSLRKFWVLDDEGIKKANFKISEQIPEESTSQVKPQRVVQVTNIDPKQESFDLTSRWIRMNSSEQKTPARFMYVADPADWVDRVEFWYQDVVNTGWRSHLELQPNNGRTGDSETTTTTTTTTTEAPEASTPVDSPTVTSQSPITTQGGSGSESIIETTTAAAAVTTVTEQSKSSDIRQPTTVLPVPVPVQTTTTDSSTTPVEEPRGAKPLDLQVNIEGLPANEFRVRVRHYLTEAARGSDQVRNLTIRALSLADICAEVGGTDRYCFNGGRCRPTGGGSAKCDCLPGYSGERCEDIRPCQVIYANSLTGEELCRAANATCIPNLPVLRCEWSNDEYYSCITLFESDPNSGKLIRKPKIDMEQKMQDQGRLIIILSVFMIALLLFSLIITINVVKRLMESKRRLRRAETEVHEMARRSQPGTSTQSSLVFGGRAQTGRNKPPVSISYNNQSFDAD